MQNNAKGSGQSQRVWQKFDPFLLRCTREQLFKEHNFLIFYLPAKNEAVYYNKKLCLFTSKKINCPEDSYLKNNKTNYVYLPAKR